MLGKGEGERDRKKRGGGSRIGNNQNMLSAHINFPY